MQLLLYFLSSMIGSPLSTLCERSACLKWLVLLCIRMNIDESSIPFQFLFHSRDYMDRFLDDIDNSMSPPPAQSLLDKSRINKPPNQVTMMAHNGVPDLQNCSPAIGGLASGDLPHEASASGTLGAPYGSFSYASSTRPMLITSEDGAPPAKKQRLKDNDLSVLENLNNFLDSNGGMNLTNSAAELLAPIDVTPAAAKPSLAHNLQNLDPITKGLLPPQAVVTIGSGLNSKEGMSRDKYGSVVGQ